MPRPKSEFEDLRPLEFREPAAVLDPDRMYTIYEVGRLLQGVEPDRDLDIETENVLLDWAIPWMLNHSEAFVFAEPESDDDPGYYGLAAGVGEGADGNAGRNEGEGDGTDA